ncbi:hypothetical protein EQG64_00320 [Streptomyces sp. S6]|nr:hypothetical protein EQG64_00320 [Streptomyces sp. S6]
MHRFAAAVRPRCHYRDHVTQRPRHTSCCVSPPWRSVGRGCLPALRGSGLSVPFFDRLIAPEAAGDPRGEVREHG